MKSKESGNSLGKRLSGLTGMFVVLIVLSTTIGAAVPFQIGDVFAAVNNGDVQHYNSTGFLLETLNTGLGGFTTGMAFDSSGNLYVTDFSASNVSKFNNTGTLLGTFGSGYSGSPESILFDAVGNAYVGAVNGDNDIRKFSAAGIPLAQFNVATGPRGSDWIDLAADQCTMFYTSEGTNVKRFNVCTNVQLTDFVPLGTLHGAAFALRLLPDGGLLVADSQDIHRLNSTGAIVQTYDVLGQNGWFALNLDPDGTSFWSGDYGNDKFFKFDITSGALLMTVDTGKGGSNLFGLAVFGELTAANPSFTVTKDFRFTEVNFTAVPAQLGNLLPHTDSNFTVKYVLKPKDGTVSSTNPGQLYGVITINGTGVSNATVNDTFGTQFDVNPGKLGGGVEVLRVNTTTGVAAVITNTPQITFASVDNMLNKVDLAIELATPLASDEKLMVYIKFQTSLKGLPPDFSDFVNNASLIINKGSPITAIATIKFV